VVFVLRWSKKNKNTIDVGLISVDVGLVQLDVPAVIIPLTILYAGKRGRFKVLVSLVNKLTYRG
jgi:hypothetical protein